MRMASKSSTTLPCSIPSLFLSFTLLCILSLPLLFLFYQTPQKISSHPPPLPHKISHNTHESIKVYVADLPRSLNYGLLDEYWSLRDDTRLGSDVDNELRSVLSSRSEGRHEFPPYPENPLIKQYSAEYWILGDLMTTQELRGGSFAKRVFGVDEADVVFVPFFATLSAEIQLGMAKGVFRKKVGNEDFERQKRVIDLIRGTDAWKRSGGRDLVFVLTGYVKT